MSDQYGHNLGGRPMGYGRPQAQSDPGYSGTPPPGSGMSSLNRLVANIGHAQRSRGGADPNAGFQGYSYNDGKGSGALNGLFRGEMEQPLSDEQYRLNTIEQATNKSNELFGYLLNRYGRYYQTVKSTMDYFVVSKVTQKPDPVCSEFIEEVLNNQDLYKYCCSYACLFFSSAVTTYVLSGRAEELLKNDQAQFELIGTSFVNVLGLAFMGWFEHHPNAIALNQKMFPETRARLESFESKMDELRNALISISVGGTKIPFPWKKGVMQRVIDKSHVGSAVYETYQMYNDSTVVESTGWGTATVGGTTPGMSNGHASGPLDANGKLNIEWLDELVRQTGNSSEPIIPKTQAYDFTNSTVSDNWDAAPSFERKPEMETIDSRNKELEALSEKVTEYNRLDFDFRIWFKPLPGTNCYTIVPTHLRNLARILDYNPSMNFEHRQEWDNAYANRSKFMPSYQWGSWEEQGCIPVVRLDWQKGEYAFYNLHVGKDNVEPMLTNPDKVLPYVSTIERTIKRPAIEATSFEDVIQMTPEEMREIFDGPRGMDKPPDVIYGNSVSIVKDNKEVIETIDKTTEVAKLKKPNVDVVAVGMKSMIPVEFDDVTIKDVEEHIPILVKGNEEKLSCVDFFDTIVDGLGNISNRAFTRFVGEHLTNIVNRWLVEKRFYSEIPKNPEYLKVGNILEDYIELSDCLRNKDSPTRELFLNLAQEDFLWDQFKMFSNSATQDRYTERRLEFATTIYDKEMLKLDASKMLYIEKEFITAKVMPMKPYQGNQTKVIISGSEVPQIRWLEETIPKYLNKHFGKEVPILIRFANDDSPRLWALTKSGYCNSKFTLRRLCQNSIIPLMHVVDS